jgi:hypothetical protein
MSHDFGHHDGAFDAGAIGWHHDSPASSNDGGAANPVEVQGVSISEDMVVIEVLSHGACDIKRKFEELVQEAGIISLDKCTPNLVAEEQMQMHIAGRRALDDSNNKELPAGSRLSSTGNTRMWRTHWQIGQRKNWWAFWEELGPWKTARVYIKVSCITWFYAQVGDYQTYMIIKVERLPVWDVGLNQWRHNQKAFIPHKKAAEDLGNQIYEFLRSVTPLESATKMRDEHAAELIRQRVAAERAAPDILRNDLGSSGMPAAVGAAIPVINNAVDESKVIDEVSDAATSGPSTLNLPSGGPGNSGSDLTNVFEMPDPVSGVPGAGDSSLPDAPIGEQAEIISD